MIVSGSFLEETSCNPRSLGQECHLVCDCIIYLLISKSFLNPHDGGMEPQKGKKKRMNLRLERLFGAIQVIQMVQVWRYLAVSSRLKSRALAQSVAFSFSYSALFPMQCLSLYPDFLEIRKLQSQVFVGIGLLAGPTIMLLTIIRELVLLLASVTSGFSCQRLTRYQEIWSRRFWCQYLYQDRLRCDYHNDISHPVHHRPATSSSMVNFSKTLSSWDCAYCLLLQGLTFQPELMRSLVGFVKLTGWTWAQKEVICSMVGVDPNQGCCFSFQGSIPCCCRRIAPWGPFTSNRSPVGARAVFWHHRDKIPELQLQLSVGLSGPPNATVKLPKNFTFARSRGRLRNQATIEAPSLFLSSDGLRETC